MITVAGNQTFTFHCLSRIEKADLVNKSLGEIGWNVVNVN